MAKPEQGTESMELVAVTDPSALAEILTGSAEIAQVDSAQTQKDIITRILSATTAEEAMADTPTYSTEDLVGVPFEVDSCSIARSRFGNDGKGGFLVCWITRMDNGERAILTTSAAKVAARILWFATHEMLPQKFTVRPPVVSGNGFNVYDVESV